MLIIARRKRGKDRLSNPQASKIIMPNHLIFNKESVKNLLEREGDFRRTLSTGFLGSPSDRSAPPTSM